jgi:hypothetical protein
MKEEKVQKLLAQGKITQEQANVLMVKVPQATILEATPYKVPLFNHNYADQHYEQRMDLEEGVRHALGLPVYGLIAGIDSIIDAIGFGITELVEDFTFTTSRVIYRARDGWTRGKIK